MIPTLNHCMPYTCEKFLRRRLMLFSAKVFKSELFYIVYRYRYILRSLFAWFNQKTNSINVLPSFDVVFPEMLI